MILRKGFDFAHMPSSNFVETVDEKVNIFIVVYFVYGTFVKYISGGYENTIFDGRQIVRQYMITSKCRLNDNDEITINTTFRID